jgi:amino acid transporter
MWGLLRRIVIGRPLPLQSLEHEKLGVLGGLAVFACDALSSVAYGTEETLRILVLAGAAGLAYTAPVGIAIALLLVIVATSYRQTVMEYSSGGGAYVVSRDNLGTAPAYLAGAALLVDYVLTVAVSVAAGVAAITSAWPAVHDHRVALAVICVVVMMLVNLRGMRESAHVFAVPVYGFIGLMLFLVVFGLARYVTGNLSATTAVVTRVPVLESLTFFLVLRAFSSGCAALTGIEAVANGVQAFRTPSGLNGARVMVLLASLLSVMFIGTTLLAHAIGVVPSEHETVLSQIGRVVFGDNAAYYMLQAATALILILAANTSFAGFPRLAAFMAQDGYLPRQLTNLGDRLVYSNGIVVLGVLAAALIALFGGQVTRLIPLYAVGVFTAFTLSQSGMVLHWYKQGTGGWRRKAIVNGIGASVTAVVLVVVVTTKFLHGAWIVCLIIPLMILGFRAIWWHYSDIASRLTLERASEVHPMRNLNLLLIGGMHKGTLQALQYIKSMHSPTRAIHVETQGEDTPRVLRLWRRWEHQIPLVVVPAPYRNITGPLLEYIHTVRQQEHYDIVTVVLPEFVVDTWWEALLHNHSALWLQIALRNVPGVAVLNMRYQV